MKLAALRWAFFAAALLAAACALFLEATPGRLGAATACGLAWFLLSRRKVLSLDRESLGLRPRRRPLRG